MNLSITVQEGIIFAKKNFFILLFFTIYLFSSWLTINSNLSLTQVSNGIVGIATLELSDVNARISLFYKSLFILSCLFLLILASTTFIKKIKLFSSQEILIINYLSAIGTFAMILNLLLSNNHNTIKFIILNILLVLSNAVVRKLTLTKFSLTKYHFIYVALSAFCLTSLTSALAGYLFPSLKVSFTDVYFFISLTPLLLMSKFEISGEKLNKLFFLTRPLFILPTAYFLCVEFYLVLNQRSFTSFPIGIIFGIGVLILALYFISLQRKLKSDLTLPDIKTQINYFGIPWVLVAVGFYVFYKPIIKQPTELFELANPANAMMRLFEHGEIPILQAFSSHLLSDQLFGELYFILNGYNQSTDFTIYQSLYFIVCLVIFYFFLLKISGNSLLSLSVILFYPFYNWLLPEAYTLPVVSIFLLYNLFKEYSFKKLFVIYLYSFSLILWSIDIGVANTLSTGGILLLYLIFNYNLNLLKDYLKAFAYIILPILLIVFFIILIFEIPITTNLKQALDYISSSQAHGYGLVSYSQDKYYYMHYFGFPMATLAMLIYTLHKFISIKNNPKLSFNYLALIFLLIYNLANAQRGLVRHSFIEYQDQFISTFMFFIIPFFIVLFPLKNIKWRFAFMILLSALIVNAYKLPYQPAENFFHTFQDAFKARPIVTSSETPIKRTITNPEFETQNFSSLKKFFDDNFEKEATFIDFSNTPMLYFYLHKKVPSYFNQYMQNTVTSYQQKENLNYVKKFNVPIVVFSHVPEQWWDNTDGVPNPLRYHITSNYIFNNYIPLTVLNNYFIWVKKGTPLKQTGYPIPDSTLLDRHQKYDLKYFPFILAKSGNQTNDKVLFEWNSLNFNNDSLIISTDIDKSKGNKIIVTIDNIGEQTTAILNYFDKDKNLGSFTFIVPANTMQQTYSVPVSTQYNWHRNSPSAFKITLSSEKAKMKKASLVAGEI